MADEANSRCEALKVGGCGIFIGQVFPNGIARAAVSKGEAVCFRAARQRSQQVFLIGTELARGPARGAASYGVEIPIVEFAGAGKVMIPSEDWS